MTNILRTSPISLACEITAKYEKGVHTFPLTMSHHQFLFLIGQCSVAEN